MSTAKRISIFSPFALRLLFSAVTPAYLSLGLLLCAFFCRSLASLFSRSGNEQQFISMVSACKNAGVGVIVDAVINHMATDLGDPYGGNATWSAASMSYLHDPPSYGWYDFHHPVCQIQASDYETGNLQNVRNCEIDSCPDVATEAEHPRAMIAQWMVSCIDVASLLVTSVDRGGIPTRSCGLAMMPIPRVWNCEIVPRCGHGYGAPSDYDLTVDGKLQTVFSQF